MIEVTKLEREQDNSVKLNATAIYVYLIPTKSLYVRMHLL